MKISWLWGGRSGDSQHWLSFKKTWTLRIATSAPHYVSKWAVIPSPPAGGRGISQNHPLI